MNTQLLKRKMAAYGDSQARLAAGIGRSTSNLNDKITGKVSFRQNDIAAIRRRYHLSAEEVDLIFFSPDCLLKTNSGLRAEDKPERRRHGEQVPAGQGREGRGETDGESACDRPDAAVRL